MPDHLGYPPLFEFLHVSTLRVVGSCARRVADYVALGWWEIRARIAIRRANQALRAFLAEEDPVESFLAGNRWAERKRKAWRLAVRAARRHLEVK